ncbi:hypothetical protein C0J45_15109 [Silurus meridionalis]|nr:hypothetical protein C0J45_15109 [Silurus meridionalis]
MKLFYFFLFCFTIGINPTEGQLHQESGGILLRFVFHPNYNNYEKSCCKFSNQRCLAFVTSKGFVSNAYKGRIETYQYSGIFDVQIWNLRKMDAGIYSCFVVQTPAIHMIFQVDITDKCGSNVPSLPNITQHPPQELVYTTVDFKCHHKTSNIYENLNIHNSSSDSDNAVKTQDSVEYATISRVL